MDYSQIKIELERKNISIRDLCERIDVSEQGLHQMIRKKSMKVEVLERISNVLKLPVTYWFEDTTSKRVNTFRNDKTGKQLSSKLTHEKIDTLTKELNEMLKEIIVSL